MIKAGYYARVDYTILKEFLSIQRPLNQHVTGNYKRVLSFVLCPDILSRELLLYYSYIVFLVVSARLWSKDGTSFVSFFLYRLKTFFDISLLLYASTVLITRSFNFLLARIRNDLYYCQFSKISFNYLLSLNF